MLVAASSAVLLALMTPQPAAAATCERRPLPSPLESLAPAPIASTIAFSATPSVGSPVRPWVVRLSRRGDSGQASVEILRLRRQRDCNLYDIETSWRAPLTAQEFDEIADKVLPVAAPGREGFSPDAAEVALDGTGIEVQAATSYWQATRQLHASGPRGASMSAIFHALVLRIVPAAERPTTSWRMGGR